MSWTTGVDGPGFREQVIRGSRPRETQRNRDDRIRLHVLEHPSDVAVHVADPDIEPLLPRVLGPGDPLVVVAQLRVRMDVVRAPPEQRVVRGRWSAGDCTDGHGTVRHRSREVRVEVVRREQRVRRQCARGEIVRHTCVVAAVVREHLRSTAPGRIPHDAEPGRPVVLQREAFHDRARERFLLVPHARADRQRIAHLPLVLHEQPSVVLRRPASRREAGAVHVVDLAEHGVGDDIDDGAGGRLLTVRRGERGTRVLLQLREIEILVVEAIPDLMRAVPADDVGGLRLNLPAFAAVARFVETQASSHEARCDPEVTYLPSVRRRGLDDAIERVAE